MPKLLSERDTNPKVAKNNKLGWATAVMHLSPSDTSGVMNVCPKASAGCREACLHWAGHQFSVKYRARVARTVFFHEDRAGFLAQLEREIAAHVRWAEAHDLHPAVRLNGTSDLTWEKIAPSLFSIFTDVQFYDYTKMLNRLRGDLPVNYHLTFSLSEDNEDEALEALARGFNVAAVFEHVPETFLGRPVIDGDEHDFRPADPEGVIVGLKVKGVRGRADETGFVNRERGLPIAA